MRAGEAQAAGLVERWNRAAALRHPHMVEIHAAGACTLVMVTHRPAVLELVNRVVVIDGGRVVMDGPKDQVLAALSGARPAAAPQAGAAAPSNLHMHPSAQPVQREASV